MLGLIDAYTNIQYQIIPSRRPTYNFDPNATYVISGGLGGLGRSMAQWMANRGAKHLILLSRSGATRDSAKELVEGLEAANVKVATPPCDVSDMDSLTQVLNECLTDMPSIKGCIQGSMVLKVRRLQTTSEEVAANSGRRRTPSSRTCP